MKKTIAHPLMGNFTREKAINDYIRVMIVAIRMLKALRMQKEFSQERKDLAQKIRLLRKLNHSFSTEWKAENTFTHRFLNHE